MEALDVRSVVITIPPCYSLSLKLFEIKTQLFSVGIIRMDRHGVVSSLLCAFYTFEMGLTETERNAMLWKMIYLAHWCILN